MELESRIIEHGEAAPADLVANPHNWRVHPQAQLDALAAVLDTVGWVQDVIFNRQSGYLLDGHARVAIATQRGETSVPVVYVDLNEEEERLMLATLDPLSAMAESDRAALEDLLALVKTEDEALGAMFGALANGYEPLTISESPSLGPEFDEQIADGITICECKACGHEHHKQA